MVYCLRAGLCFGLRFVVFCFEFVFGSFVRLGLDLMHVFGFVLFDGWY